MSPSSLNVITYTLLASVIMLVLMAVTVWVFRSRRSANLRVFETKATALGFSQSRARYHAHLHWVGTWQSHQTILGYHHRNARTRTFVGRSGVVLIVHSGKLPLGKAGAELSTPARLFGEETAALETLLSPERLSEAARIPHATLFPADELLPGSIQDLVIKNGTTQGWTGLAMMAVLPKTSTQPEIRATLDQMTSWLEKL